MSAQRRSEAAFIGQAMPPGEDPGLEATAYFDPPSSAFAFGTAAALVEVDTRDRRVRRRALRDGPRLRQPVNPKMVEGQVQGALAQGFAAGADRGAASTTATRGSSSTGRWSTTSCRPRPTCRTSSCDHTGDAVAGHAVRHQAAWARAAPSPPRPPSPTRVCDALAAFGVELDRLPVTAGIGLARARRRARERLADADPGDVHRRRRRRRRCGSSSSTSTGWRAACPASRR